MIASSYIGSYQKRALDVVISLALLMMLAPAIVIISLIILTTAGWPIIFFQKRVGKHGTIFTMYKFRTMYNGADLDQTKYRQLNQANGPVFKIRNDPRFVGIGEWLSNTGLDELPQLWNVLLGNMSIVGPRPLPSSEEQQIRAPIRKWRRLAKPGIISHWILLGCHRIPFSKWMQTDIEYIQKATITSDLSIIFQVALQQINSLFT